MKRFTSTAIAAALTGLMSATAWADDTALLIGNERYQSISRAENGNAAIHTQWAFQQLGFDIISTQNVASHAIEASLKALMENVKPNDSIAIVLTGHFVVSGETTWFMLSDARRPSIANISTRAIPVSLIMDIAAQHPGKALVALGTATNNVSVGQNIKSDIGNINPPQGVTVVTGTSSEVAVFLNREALKEGAVFAEALKNTRIAVQGHGFLPSTPFVAANSEPAPVFDAELEREQAYWQFASDLGTLEAYQAYLKFYPRGLYVDTAKREIAFINSEPERTARAAEEALNLSRTDRRKIQSDLTLLGFNTRGIDGLFGVGTRGALGNWQADAGFEKTGYINRQQLVTLNGQARQKNRELEEEAKKREAQLRREDRALWQETGKGRTEEGLRKYLKRFPDGLFSEAANEKLAAIEIEKRGRVTERERLVWDQALAANDLTGYNRYLGGYPNGSFVEAAKAKISALQNSNTNLIEAARLEESKLGLAPVTFLLVEQKLTKLGFEPGRIDGKLSEESRRAIRRFQRAAELPVTGYLSRATVVRLIAAN